MPQPTLEEVAVLAIGRIKTDATVHMAADYIRQRYRDVASSARFNHLRRVRELSVPGEEVAGTVSVASGARIVTGTDTAFVPDFIGRYIRVQNVWHEIDAVPSETELRLTSAYTEPSATDSGYQIIKKYHELPEDVRWMDHNLTHQRMGMTILYIDQSIVDAKDPRRLLVSTDSPFWWSFVTVDGKNREVIELYPYQRNAELFNYVCWVDPPWLELDQSIPAFLSREALVEGAVIDLLMYEMTNAAMTDFNRAALLRNEMNTLKTRWQRRVQDEIKNDRSPDGVTFIRELRTYRSRMTHPVPTTESHIVSNW